MATTPRLVLAVNRALDRLDPAE
ncbi:hypothetical protein EMIT0P43_40241 [Pseudomonas jessenii]